ncbi:DNA repair protein Rad60 [Amyelois transitella]|uniref:DNA repair protein Rad60 n=1 Tax=Amyelois transitella TaxID=680683 RepID=UPI00298F5495|nr:DNA repair protein Rad60 [Amyelois transitella]
MSSSDSDDDCYGNIAKKLQSMKNKYTEDKVEYSSILNESSEIDEIVKKAGIGAKTVVNPVVNTKKADEDESFELSEDLKLECLLAGSSKRVTRASSKRGKKKDETNEEMPAPTRRKSDESPNESSRGQRGRGRGRRGRHDTNNGVLNISASNTGRGRGRRGRATPRGRRGRGRHRPNWQSIFDEDFETAVTPNTPVYPTYSVGNTDEYPDQSESQSLFSKKPQTQTDIVIIDDNDPLEENEELSVKVYWQSAEYFKFSIRKYQKLTSIFDYFAKKENVNFDKLFFTFNDRILKPDDTPDSINYNIVKFIDGGIVNQSVSKLVTNNKNNVTNGIKLKFQCQNVKKPFETVIRLEERLSVAMLKCAEFFEKPLDKLRFEFDGDTLSGKNTPEDLELEGGECIDVKILS